MSTNIEWTDRKVAFLRVCWNAGMVTNAIGLRFTEEFGEILTKNGVVGKVGRMKELAPHDWPARPSPIRKTGQAVVKKTKPKTLPPLPALKAPPAPRPPPNLMAQFKPKPPCPTVQAVVSILRSPALACEARRDPDQPLRRLDGTGCLWPLGDPGTPAFRFCDDPLCSLSRPYCATHRDLAYTKTH